MRHNIVILQGTDSIPPESQAEIVRVLANKTGGDFFDYIPLKDWCYLAYDTTANIWLSSASLIIPIHNISTVDLTDIVNNYLLGD